MTELHQFIDLSNKRRVFAVGDIHGEYEMLDEALVEVDFDKTQDVLISVGDLADRGPFSERALDIIDEPWFFRVLGNHDIAPRLYLDRQIEKHIIDKNFGGAWFTKLPQSHIEAIAQKFKDAPVALTVKTPGGYNVGIVHADCMSDWPTHIAMLKKIWVYDLSLWSRVTCSVYDICSFSKNPVLPFCHRTWPH